MKRSILTSFYLLFSLLASAAYGQSAIPIGDSNVFCLVTSDGIHKLAQFTATGYELVLESNVVKGINKKLTAKKEKKNRLVEALSQTAGQGARQKIKNKIQAVKNEITALKLDKQRIGECLDGLPFVAGFAPIKIASKQIAPSTWNAWAYIDPRPIRVNLAGGGYSQFGSYGSLWCVAYQGTFFDNTIPPWPPGTEFSLVKDFDLCDTELNVPGGACKDVYGTNNAGIPVALKTGETEEEARANLSAFIGTISYSARIQRASTCAGDLSLL